MQIYKLTQEADFDLENIFNYGVDNFGVNAAVLFYQGISETFEKIAGSPDRYPKIDILPEYRRAVFQTYSIFFVQRQDYIEVVRILRKELVTVSLFE